MDWTTHEHDADTIGAALAMEYGWSLNNLARRSIPGGFDTFEYAHRILLDREYGDVDGVAAFDTRECFEHHVGELVVKRANLAHVCLSHEECQRIEDASGIQAGEDGWDELPEVAAADRRCEALDDAVCAAAWRTQEALYVLYRRQQDKHDGSDE